MDKDLQEYRQHLILAEQKAPDKPLALLRFFGALRYLRLTTVHLLVRLGLDYESLH